MTTTTSHRACLGFVVGLVLFGSVGAMLWPMRNSSGPVAGSSAPLPPATTSAPTSATNEPPPPDPAAYDLEAAANGAPVPRAAAKVPTAEESEAGGDFLLRNRLARALLVLEQVRDERRRLWDIRVQLRSGTTPAAEDRLWLALVADRYETAGGDLEEMARRVDTVPPSILIALAQISATLDAPAPAKGRSRIGRGHVDAPPGPEDEMAGWLHRLNTGSPFAGFRRERARLRSAGQPPDALGLVSALPTDGAEGLLGARRLTAAIVAGGLTRFDAARLAPPETAGR